MKQQLAPAATKLLAKELCQLTEKQPCEGITVSFSEDNIYEVFADIAGPCGTPYEGGVFRLKVVLGSEFPAAPPKGTFLTKVFHPNVSEAGEVCVNVLKKDWKPDLGIKHVLLVVRCLLIEPFAESALNEEAGRLLLEDYNAFHQQAQLMTQIHAIPSKRPVPLGTRQDAQNADAHANVAAPAPPVTEGCSSPAPKKAKGVTKSNAVPAGSAAAAKKRALKRL